MASQGDTVWVIIYLGGNKNDVEVFATKAAAERRAQQLHAGGGPTGFSWQGPIEVQIKA